MSAVNNVNQEITLEGGLSVESAVPPLKIPKMYILVTHSQYFNDFQGDPNIFITDYLGKKYVFTKDHYKETDDSTIEANFDEIYFEDADYATMFRDAWYANAPRIGSE